MREDELREELDIGVGDVVVFGGGTRDWRKGPDLFFEIARLACAGDRRLKFVWIGGEPAAFMEKVRSAEWKGAFFSSKAAENLTGPASLGDLFSFLRARILVRWWRSKRRMRGCPSSALRAQEIFLIW